MLIALPDLPGLFEGVDWTFDVPQQKNRSEFTRRTQVIGTPGAESWLARATVLPNASEAEARAWRVFIVSCRGSENTFHLPAARPWPTPSGNPTVTAAVAGNQAVTVSDASEIQPGMFATVEQASGHFRLVLVRSVVGSTVHFEPYLTGNPEIGAVFEIIEPFCPMRLTQKAVPLPVRPRPIGFTFEAEEAL